MKSTLSALLSALLLVFALSGCRTSSYAGKGALLGGLGGAGVGAAIGSHNGDAGAGALIGSAIGALGGAAIGSDMDAAARSQAIIQERMGRRMEGAVKFNDVVAMSSAGVADDIIVTHIEANGVAQHPKVADIIKLNEQGVSQAVITAMQETPLATALVRNPRPVYVEEHYYVDPYHHGPYHHAPVHHGPVHHAPHVDWHFNFGH